MRKSRKRMSRKRMSKKRMSRKRMSRKLKYRGGSDESPLSQRLEAEFRKVEDLIIQLKRENAQLKRELTTLMKQNALMRVELASSGPPLDSDGLPSYLRMDNEDAAPPVRRLPGEIRPEGDGLTEGEDVWEHASTQSK